MNDVRPEVLISRLTSDNEAWRVDAERHLLALGDAAVEPLMGALKHASPAVRIHAVHALGHIRAPRAIPAVVQALSETENLGAVAIAAEKALAAWGAPVKPVLVDLAQSGDESVRPRAIRTLGKIGGDNLRDVFAALLSDSSASVRTQAAAAMAAAFGEQAIEFISPLLSDPDKWVRYGVAEALVGVGSVRGELALREAREDPEEAGSYVPYWAEELLDQISELRRTGRALL
jgi:HEAT repeat protein